ncbi:MAG: hypothetical protein NTX49_10490 [Chlamydiae bacterium]|nr:hypothetical protein [Chlamydiota bacterium]
MTVGSCCFSSGFCLPITAWFTPSRAENLNEEVSRLVQRIEAFKGDDPTIHPTEKVRVFQQIDAVLKKWEDKSTAPKFIQTLEKTALAYRLCFPINLPENTCQIESLKELVKKHDSANFKRWSLKCGLDPELYFAHPDFANFILSAFIHKSFEFFGKNQINHGGQVGLLIEGKFTPWEEISKRFVVEDGKIFSTDTGVKKRWIFLSEGLVCHDPYNWKMPAVLMKLEVPPGRYLLQVVTSHIKPANQGLIDRVTDGAMHSWFRIITPDGNVYSFGMLHDRKDINLLQPMSSIKNKISCPDVFETYAEKRIETTIPIEGEHVFKIGEIIKKYSRDENIQFHYLKSNCTSFLQEVLTASGIGGIPNTKMTISRMIGKFIFPKPVRRIMKNIWEHTFGLIIPTFISKGFSTLVNIVTSLIAFPVISLLGGWFKTPKRISPQVAQNTTPAAQPQGDSPISRAPEQELFISLFTQDQWDKEADHLVTPLVGPLYNHLGDVFKPDILSLDMPSRIAKWQLAQGAQTRVI